eukprot:UN01836
MIVYAEGACTTRTDSETGSIFHECGKARAECVSPGSCPNGDCTTMNDFFPPQSCGELEISFEFPDCWDGSSLDSANHRSHVAYEDPNNDDECPSTHSTRIPKV